MFENVNEAAVLVSVLLAMAVGSIWYSPLLFGKHWMRATGLTEADLEASKEKMPKLLVGAFVANLLLLYMIAQFVAFTQAAHKSLEVTATYLVLFLFAVMASAVIWEKKTLPYLFINVGYATVVVFGGMTVIWYWPW